MNVFPSDFNNNLTGFGGDPSKNQAQHRAAIKKTPVILVHGNAGNSAHPKWGMRMMAEFLKSNGYLDSEIWAMDYLGENNSRVVLDNVHIDHINALRTFVDRVRTYLGVSRVDFISHSLGCGMVNGYLRGLQSSGQ
jgi:pimeloyl-ACP methyl ester carboxylesterase